VSRLQLNINELKTYFINIQIKGCALYPDAYNAPLSHVDLLVIISSKREKMLKEERSELHLN